VPKRIDRFRLTTSDLLIALPLIALVMLLLSTLLQRAITPSVETYALLSFNVPVHFPPFQPRVQQAGAEIEAFLHSPESASVLMNDPTLSAQQQPISADRLQQMLQQNLRVDAIRQTLLLKITMRVEEPVRDTALLNAAVNSFIKAKGTSRFQMVVAAAPPRIPSRSHRLAVIAMYLVSVFLLSLIVLFLVKWCRSRLSRHRSASDSSSVESLESTP
jgi:hypothetical protein